MKTGTKAFVIAVLVLVLVFFASILAGCGAVEEVSEIDSSDSSGFVMVKMPDGSIFSGEVFDIVYGSSGTVIVTIEGKSYKTHASNFVLIK